MNREIYEFCNIFWEDKDFDLKDGIPKYYTVETDADGLISYNFTYLNEEEVKQFLKIKVKEDPEMLNELRYKKLLRIIS